MATKTPKPQAAVDSGLLTKQEAAAYLGISYQAFNLIARQIPHIRLGLKKYYKKENLLKYLANIQHLTKAVAQQVHN